MVLWSPRLKPSGEGGSVEALASLRGWSHYFTNFSHVYYHLGTSHPPTVLLLKGQSPYRVKTTEGRWGVIWGVWLTLQFQDKVSSASSDVIQDGSVQRGNLNWHPSCSHEKKNQCSHPGVPQSVVPQSSTEPELTWNRGLWLCSILLLCQLNKDAVGTRHSHTSLLSTCTWLASYKGVSVLSTGS